MSEDNQATNTTEPQYGWTQPTENGLESTDGAAQAKPKPKLIPENELNQMVAACMRDEDEDDKADAAVDEEDVAQLEQDADLMHELQTITGEKVESVAAEPTAANEAQYLLPTSVSDTVELIRKRLLMYEEAEAHAKESGEAARSRRLERGLKTLQDLLQQALAGNAINVTDIPGEVSIKASTGTADAPQTPTSPEPSAPPAEVEE